MIYFGVFMALLIEFLFFFLGNDFFFYLCKVICEDVKVTSSV